MSRPQIHGFDLNCVAISPTTPEAVINRPGALYIAGDEKVIRVLDCPGSVLRGVHALTGVHIIDPAAAARSPRVDRAYIPELGLSNKAAELMSAQEQAEKSARNVDDLAWQTSPLEGQLVTGLSCQSHVHILIS